MKLAVIKTGGKQYVVKEKDKLKVEKLALKAGESVEFEALLIADGDNVQIGAPVVGKVSASVIGEGRSKKVIGIKYKPKTRYRKKFGHRQSFTQVEIAKI